MIPRAVDAILHGKNIWSQEAMETLIAAIEKNSTPAIFPCYVTTLAGIFSEDFDVRCPKPLLPAELSPGRPKAGVRIRLARLA